MEERLIIKISKKLEYWEPSSPKKFDRTSPTIFGEYPASRFTWIKKKRWYEWLDIVKAGWDHNFHIPFKYECFSKVPKLSRFSCCYIAFSSFSFPNFCLHILWILAEWLNKDALMTSPPLSSSTQQELEGQSVIQTSVCGHLVPCKLLQDPSIGILKSFGVFRLSLFDMRSIYLSWFHVSRSFFDEMECWWVQIFEKFRLHCSYVQQLLSFF